MNLNMDLALAREAHEPWSWPRFVYGLLAALALWALSSLASAQTLTFTAQTTTGNGSVVPVLTWSTAPAAKSCAAGGAWSGAKAAAGSETLPAIATTANFDLSCLFEDETMVTWELATKNTDTTDYVNPKLVRIRYGTSPTALSQTRDVPHPGVRTSFTGLAVGTWNFTAESVNQADVASAPIGPITKVVTASAPIARSVRISVNPLPLPPTNLTVASCSQVPKPAGCP